MKIDQLDEKNVQVKENPRTDVSLVTLDETSLHNVVGGSGRIDSSICEIHFYYPADGTT